MCFVLGHNLVQLVILALAMCAASLHYTLKYMFALLFTDKAQKFYVCCSISEHRLRVRSVESFTPISPHTTPSFY